MEQEDCLVIPVKDDMYISSSGGKYKIEIKPQRKVFSSLKTEPKKYLSPHYVGSTAFGDYSYHEFIELFNTIENSSNEITTKSREMSKIKAITNHRAFRRDLANFILKYPVDLVKYCSLIVLVFSIVFIIFNLITKTIIISPIILFLLFYSSSITLAMAVIEKRRTHA